VADRPDLGDWSWAPRLRAERQAAGSPAITAIVHTLNEERNLPDCLRSLAWTDELLVVDMHSDDATREIAEQHGARVLLHERTGYVEPARNAAHDAAAGEWLAVVDADERVPEQLARDLDAIAREDRADVVDVPTRNWLCGRWLEATGWAGDWHPRFYRRGTVTWSPRIHSMPEIRGRRLQLPIEPAILHFGHDDLHAFVRKTNTYTDKEADAADGPASWDQVVAEARQEIAHRWSPDVDGTQSVALSMAMFFYRFLARAKTWERHDFPDVGAPRTGQEALRDLAGEGRRLHQHGITAFERGSGARARGLLEDAVRASVDLELLSDLAVVCHNQGDVEQAVALLEVVLLLDPAHEGARENLAALAGAEQP
jgi:hypothetical protein